MSRGTELQTQEDLAIETYGRPSLPTSRDVLTMLFRQRRAFLIAFLLVLVGATLSGIWCRPK